MTQMNNMSPTIAPKSAAKLYNYRSEHYRASWGDAMEAELDGMVQTLSAALPDTLELHCEHTLSTGKDEDNARYLKMDSIAIRKVGEDKPAAILVRGFFTNNKQGTSAADRWALFQEGKSVRQFRLAIMEAAQEILTNKKGHGSRVLRFLDMGKGGHDKYVWPKSPVPAAPMEDSAFARELDARIAHLHHLNAAYDARVRK